MNLAFCLLKYFPFGGLQRDFLRIAEECVRRGHRVDVYTQHWEGERPTTITIHEMPTHTWQNHTRIEKFSQQLKTIFANRSYDLVVGFNKMPGLDVYYAADTCYQAKAQSRSFLYRLTPRYRKLKSFEASIFSKSKNTDILLLSPLQQKIFIDTYETPPERFHLLPPGIEKNRIAPDDVEDVRKKMRIHFSIQENEFLALMIGSGFKTKGLDRILHGFAQLPADIKKRAHLWIIGKDNPKKYNAMAKRLKIFSRIKFLGGRNDVPDFLLAGDVLLHPAYNENTGTVLLEALASGLPVLTTDVCGYADYIQRAQAGIVMPSPFQQTEFNKTLLMMLLSREQKQWRANGIAFAKQHNLYGLVSCAVDTLESLVAKGKHRAT